MRPVVACVLVLVLGLGPSASAATLGVGPGQDHATFADAVAAAGAGDLLVLAAGQHAVDAPVLIDVPVVISGPGAELVGDALLEVVADVRLEDLTLRPADGAAVVHTGGELVLWGVTVQRGPAHAAPAVQSSGAVHLVVEASTFRDLRSGSLPGGAVRATGGATVGIHDTRFIGTAGPSGGAIALVGGGSLTVAGSTFTDTHAVDAGGGAILVDGDGTSIVHVADSHFLDATAVTTGGAIHLQRTASAALLRNTFDGCRAKVGGAVRLAALAGVPGAHVVEDNTFRHNEAVERGGALLFSSGTPPYVHANLWCANAAGTAGGALALDVSGVIVENERFVGNRAQGDGGALWAGGGGGPRDLFRNLTFAGGSAGGRGAHLASFGPVLLRNVLFLGAAGAPALDADDRDEAYDAFWDNAAGDVAQGTVHETSLRVDPLVVAFLDDDACEDDLRPRYASPLRDGGDPEYTDPDATRSDIGAYGGLTAPLHLFEDSDLDTFADLYDCGPDDPSIFPGAPERCDGLLDEDCDGEVDEDDAVDAAAWWPDLDGDGYGAGEPVLACARPPGTSPRGSDCDDEDPDRNPGAREVCNGVDDDCDGRVDDDDVVSDAPAWPVDADGDGFAGSETVTACREPEGGVPALGDCDDDDPRIFPGADDPPDDGVDQDCDGADGTSAPVDDCGCATGGGTPGLLPLGLLFAAARRRRR